MLLLDKMSLQHHLIGKSDLYSFESVLTNPLFYAYVALVMVYFLGFPYYLVDACLVFPLNQQFFLALV